MNHGLEREIKTIIARSYPGDSDERRMLEEVFSALARHQEDFLSELKARIEEESAANDYDEDFEVAVKIVKRGDTEARRDFVPVKTSSDLVFADRNDLPFENSPPPEGEVVQVSFFLDVSYEDLKNFCEPKKYRGCLVATDGTKKNFSYTLLRHGKFIEQEKILFKLAALYKIRRPVIFSPYARKAVELKIEGLSETDFASLKTFDLMLKQNGLDGKLLTDCELCTNVEVEGSDTNHGGAIEEYIGADGNLIRYEYFHVFDRDKKIFVLPNQPCDDLRVRINDDERKITLGYNSVLKERSCRIVRFNRVKEISPNTFANEFVRRNFAPRLRSEGDLEKVLACFNATRFGKMFPAHFDSLGGKKDFRPVTIYRREDRYFIPDENRLLENFRSKTICRVKFSGDGNSQFKTDYANYVLHYLSQNYPEFTWAGVEA